MNVAVVTPLHDEVQKRDVGEITPKRVVQDLGASSHRG